MTNEEIVLIEEVTEKSGTGAKKRVRTGNERTVFAQVNGASMAEFWAAAATGRTIKLQIVVYKADYAGETLLRHDGQEYRVKRSYPPKKRVDMLELYCEAAEG